MGYRQPERESWNMQTFEMLTLQRWIFGYVVSGGCGYSNLRKRAVAWTGEGASGVAAQGGRVPDGLTLIF